MRICNTEKYRELLKQTWSAQKALEVAINIKMGIQNQLKISETARYTVSNQAANTSINSIQKSCNRPRPTSNTFAKPPICPNWGYCWSAGHGQNVSARGKKTSKNCGIANHFAKVCRKTKIPMKPKPRVSKVIDTSSEAATIVTSATVGEQISQLETLMQRHSIYDANYDPDYD